MDPRGAARALPRRAGARGQPPGDPRQRGAGAALVAGVDDPAATLRPLLGAALDNTLALGDAALTGPVVRGDVDTVRTHLAELAAYAPRTLPGYLALTRATLDRARPTAGWARTARTPSGGCSTRPGPTPRARCDERPSGRGRRPPRARAPAGGGPPGGRPGGDSSRPWAPCTRGTRAWSDPLPGEPDQARVPLVKGAHGRDERHPATGPAGVREQAAQLLTVGGDDRPDAHRSVRGASAAASSRARRTASARSGGTRPSATTRSRVAWASAR